MAKYKIIKKREIKNPTKNQKRGNKLEDIVEILLKEKHFKVKRNQIVKYDSTYSEIDFIYGIIRKKYVECKEYKRKNVPLKDITKFYGVLSIMGIKSKRGEFYTNSDYTKRAKYFAREHKLRIYNGNDLEEILEKRKLKKEIKKLKKLNSSQR